MSRLNDNLMAFETDLDRLEHVLAILKSLKDFGGSQPPTPGEEGQSWIAANELWDKTQGKHADLPLASGATLLYLAGRFEDFARTTVEIAAEELSEKCASFSQLPEKLRIALLQGLGSALQHPSQLKANGDSAETLVVELSRCISSKSKISGMLARYLSMTERNLRQDELASLTKRIGLEKVWADIGKQSEAKKFFSNQVDGETTKLAQTRLDSIMDARNKIAHPTGSTTIPDPDQVISEIGFLRVLSKVLLSVIEVYVITFQPSAKKQIADL